MASSRIEKKNFTVDNEQKNVLILQQNTSQLIFLLHVHVVDSDE
jgi:hypothetical protein